MDITWFPPAPTGAPLRDTVLTIGVFDGVHLGHQHLIDATIAQARARAAQAVVMTFDPHPYTVVRPGSARQLLISLDQRLAAFTACGVDATAIVQFAPAVMALSAVEFIDALGVHVTLRALVVGEDFALGRGREGDPTRLTAIGAERGFDVIVVERIVRTATPISSSRIRTALAEGDVALASTLLGRTFARSGVVVHGDARGRTIGFPTANLAIAPDLLLPANGVYACAVWHADTRYQAVANIGVRPTFDGAQCRFEVHLLDFAGDLYGDTLRVELCQRLRSEQRFDDIAALVAQITHDVAATGAYFAAHREEAL